MVKIMGPSQPNLLPLYICGIIASLSLDSIRGNHTSRYNISGIAITRFWSCYLGSGKTSPIYDGGTHIIGTKDVDLMLHNLRKELIYCKISSLMITFFSLSFFSLVFTSLMRQGEQEVEMELCCSHVVVSRDFSLTSLVNQEAKY